MPALAVFHLDNPDIRIEADLAQEPRFDLRVRRRRRRTEYDAEQMIARALLEGALRRGTIKNSGPVETIDLDEDRARLFRTAPAHRGERAFDIAAAQICGHPDA